MTSDTFRNFGELYRAAFAERDPERKSLLLREVQQTIERWDEPPQAWGEKKRPETQSHATRVA